MTAAPVGRTWRDQVREDVRAFYGRYLDAFASRDLANASAYVHAPFCRFSAGRTFLETTPDDVRAWLRSSWARLEDLGSAHVSADVQQIDVLDQKLAVLRAKGTRSDVRGVPLERFEITYTLMRPLPSAEWSIAAIASTTAQVARDDGDRG